jgi:hypothetical protein
VPIEVVSALLGHSSVTTTLSVYGHLTVEDARKALASIFHRGDGRGPELQPCNCDHGLLVRG